MLANNKQNAKAKEALRLPQFTALMPQLITSEFVFDVVLDQVPRLQLINQQYAQLFTDLKTNVFDEIELSDAFYIQLLAHLEPETAKLLKNGKRCSRQFKTVNRRFFNVNYIPKIVEQQDKLNFHNALIELAFAKLGDKKLESIVKPTAATIIELMILKRFIEKDHSFNFDFSFAPERDVSVNKMAAVKLYFTLLLKLMSGSQLAPPQTQCLNNLKGYEPEQSVLQLFGLPNTNVIAQCAEAIVSGTYTDVLEPQLKEGDSDFLLQILLTFDFVDATVETNNESLQFHIQSLFFELSKDYSFCVFLKVVERLLAVLESSKAKIQLTEWQSSRLLHQICTFTQKYIENEDSPIRKQPSDFNYAVNTVFKLALQLNLNVTFNPKILTELQRRSYCYYKFFHEPRFVISEILESDLKLVQRSARLNSLAPGSLSLSYEKNRVLPERKVLQDVKTIKFQDYRGQFEPGLQKTDVLRESALNTEKHSDTLNSLEFAAFTVKY